MKLHSIFVLFSNMIKRGFLANEKALKIFHRAVCLHVFTDYSFGKKIEQSGISSDKNKLPKKVRS